MFVPPEIYMLLKSNFRESLPDVADVKPEFSFDGLIFEIRGLEGFSVDVKTVSFKLALIPTP